MSRSILKNVLRASAALALVLLALALHNAAQARVVYVPANVSWFDTGISVKPGQIITITASGTAITSPEFPNSVSTPDGQSVPCPDPDYPPVAAYPCLLKDAPYGALIGKIDSGIPFKIGSSYQMEVTAWGNLYLGVNDHLNPPWVEDNQGGYDVQIVVTNPETPWCASTDPAVVFGCAEVKINPAGLTGDFYANEVLLAATQNPGQLILPPGSNKVDVRNIKSTEENFGTLFTYPDMSTTVNITENQVKSAAVMPIKKYIRGTLELTCGIKNYAGENVACSVTLDGTAQTAPIAAGQKAKTILDPGSHTVVISLTGDPAQTILWAPASITKTVVISASPYPKKLTATFSKAGHLTASLDQAGVVGDWYLDGTLMGTQTATLDQWVTPSLYHKIEVKNLTVLATPLIRPWKDSTASAFVGSGQTAAVTVKLLAVLPGGVKIQSRPNCPVPAVTTADYVVLRVRWGALTSELAIQNADHLTFQLLLDGQDVGDIRPFRQPVQAYNPAATLGCGLDQLIYYLHWDVPVGRLAAGTHTIQVTFFTDAEIFDGVTIYTPGPFFSHSNVFEVIP